MNNFVLPANTNYVLLFPIHNLIWMLSGRLHIPETLLEHAWVGRYQKMLFGSHQQTKAAVKKSRNVNYESFAKQNQDTDGFYSFNANQTAPRNKNQNALPYLHVLANVPNKNDK